MKKLTLIDASGFIFRAYHSLPPLTNPEGTPVGAVYGFINMLVKYMEASETDAIAAVFDVARVTFRNRIYEQYKANRPPPPDDLIPQFALVREAARALNIPVVEKEDFEADDLIASYAHAAEKLGMEVTIISSDKDLMQLVLNNIPKSVQDLDKTEQGEARSEGAWGSPPHSFVQQGCIKLYDPMKQKSIGAGEVQEKFGVPPDKVLDVLSLMGDSSDNVPGVPGIGPKTASELINQYGNLDTLLARAGEIKQPKRRESLIAFADQARMSRDLIRLKDDVELPVAIDQLALTTPSAEVLLPFLEKHGFKTLIGRLRQKFGFTHTPSLSSLAETQGGEAAGGEKKNSTLHHHPPITNHQSPTYTLIQSETALNEWIAKAEAVGHVCVDIETTELNPMRASLVGISMSVSPGAACYIPVGHIEKGSNGDEDLFSSGEPKRQPGQLPLERVIALLTPLLEDVSVLKIGQNIKYDMLVLKRYGIEVAPIDDTMLLSYTLHAGLHAQNMDELAERYLGRKTITFDDVTGKGKARISFAEVELEKACDYAAEDAEVTLALWHLFRPQVAAEHLLTLYETIERPLVPVVVVMEYRGIRIDQSLLSRLSHEFSKTMGELELEIHQLAGTEFNVGSPKQLGEVLFESMALPGGKKSSKSGAYSTDVQVLEQLAEQGHTIAEKVVEWRQLSKLRGTYTDALVGQINKETGRVHTSFALAVTSTGRLSSSDPNLQNIPIRTELGRLIRTAFVAEAGKKLISADYSQIELRLLADIADIAPLKAAFKEGRDIHATTAAQMFGVKESEVTGDLRRSAKTINFGIIYGISAHGLASRLGISRGEAAEYIEQYFRQYPGIRAYMEQAKEEARKYGYVTTLFGRRCHIPGIHHKNGSIRQFSERAAINAPLQGTAADIIKRAMIAVEKKLSASALNCKMLLSVHDELVFEVAEGDAEAATRLIVPLMEHAASLSVPLTVEAKTGTHWGEAH